MNPVAAEIGVKMREYVIISMVISYRSVRDHPFVLGFLSFLIYLYNSFPLIFSLLVSASPVLICTAALLGVILSYGRESSPKVDTKKRAASEVSSRKASVPEDAIVAGCKCESFDGEGYGGEKMDMREKEIKEIVSVKDGSFLIEKDCSFLEKVPLICNGFSEVNMEKKVNEEVALSFHKEEVGRIRDFSEKEHRFEEVSGSLGHGGNEKLMFVEVGDDDLNAGIGEFINGSIDVHKYSNSSDAESDLAESSSTDASMADMIPLLGELESLLEAAPQHADVADNDSDVSSEHSHRSKKNIEDSDEGIQSRGDSGYHYTSDESDNDEGQDEEESLGVEDDGGKSAITWTEDDQKSVMDLGISEIERNKRLENLIARRRARKHLRLAAEKNLIDFDGLDVPFYVPAISIAKRNPFDGLDDSYDSMGLPPIPGSALSMSFPMRNPFDLPYEPNEEKPDLKEDDFQREFAISHQKHNSFRRCETFSVGSSALGGSKQAKRDLSWRNFFLPEQLDSEGASGRSFYRQSSEVSESRVSSALDTQSVSSITEDDSNRDRDHTFRGRGNSVETKVTFNGYRVGLLDGYGGHCSDDFGYKDIEEVEKRDVDELINLEDGDTQSAVQSGIPETGELSTYTDIHTYQFLLRAEPFDNRSRSSLLPLSEVNETITDAKNDGTSNLDRTPSKDVMKQVDFLTEHLLGDRDLGPVSVCNNQREDPECISSHPADEEPAVLHKSIEKDDPDYEAMFAAF